MAAKCSFHNTRLELTPTSRYLAFAVGWAYLSLHTLLLSAATETSLLLVIPCVVAASGVIIAVIGYYCVRFARQDSVSPRFNTASVLLAFVPVSIYCVVIRWLAHNVSGNEASSLNPFPWITFTSISVVWMAITTAVLLWFGESIVWILHKLTAKNRN